VLDQTTNTTLGVNVPLADLEFPLSYLAVAGDDLLGNLEIVLLSPAAPVGTGQALFDNVRLESTTTVIPEPSSLALLSLGIFGVVGSSRRRKS